jgi:hypothetical protein
MQRVSVADVRAAWWANRALNDVRTQLAGGPLSGASIAPPARLPAQGRRGVSLVLKIRRPTCLERALIRQSWLVAHGVRRDVVIGVGSPTQGFRAHAWLDGDPDGLSTAFTELARLEP